MKALTKKEVLANQIGYKRNGHSIARAYERINPRNCPVREYTADNVYVGVCTFFLPDGKTCPRHGVVKDAPSKLNIVEIEKL